MGDSEPSHRLNTKHAEMDKPDDEITKKADQYAKRLLVRKQVEPNQSFDSFSKSLRRRKKIMDAITKNKAKKPSGKTESDDEQEEVEKSYVSKWPSDSPPSTQSSAGAKALEAGPKSSDNDNNIIRQPRSSCAQFRRDFLAGLLHSPANAQSSPAKEQPKISLGEYFGAKSHKEMRATDFLTARVLEVLEPEVVHRESEHLNFPTAPPIETVDSTTTSFSLEDTKQLEQQIDQLQLSPLPNGAATTAVIYPSLSSMERRMSERCVEQQDHPEDPRTPIQPIRRNVEEIFDAGLDDSDFATPMPAPMPWAKRDGRRDQSSKSITAFLKRIRRKPNLESTRKPSGLSYSQNGTCTISTLTLPNTPCSPFTVNEYYTTAQQTQGSRKNSPAVEDHKPFNMDDFLETALGENSRNETASPEKTDEEPTGLNRSLSVYCKSLRRSIKRKCTRGGKKPVAVPQKSPPRPEAPNSGIKKLLDLMDLYQTQIYQASKALELCESMLEFEASCERVEVERLLVVAGLGRTAVREEIRQAIGDHENVSPCCERAELKIGEFCLRLRDDQRRRQDNCEWLLIVVSEGLRVWATRAVACPSTGPKLHFPGELLLPQLAPNFRLRLSVYSMQMRPRIRYNHEDKYHIAEPKPRQRSRRRISCPRLPGGSSRTGVVRSPKQHRVRFSGIKQSAFIPCASLEISLRDLSTASTTWALTGVRGDSLLQATMEMKMECRMQLSASHAGFLTHGDEPGGLIAWSRRWCVLEGRMLLFWNYPREQEDNRPPLYAIDLVTCVSRHIDVVDRTICAKSRTLLIETARKRSCLDEDSVVFQCRESWTIVRNLLSCDSNNDLHEWQCKLNHVLCALREWNVIEANALQTSDL